MASYKEYKEQERQVHNALYTNLLLLNEFYPPSEDFKSVLDSDMFVKPNKVAFHQVIYYLLDILDSEMTKQNLQSWPPYNTSTESKFRIELVAYLKIIRTKYDKIDISVPQSSQFISPKGRQIVKFLLMLSQLVTIEHTSKIGENFVLPGKLHKYPVVAENQIRCLENRTKSIEKDNEELILKHHESYEALKCSAKIVLENLNKSRKEASEARAELNEVKLEQGQKIPSNIPLEKLHGQLDNVKDQMKVVLDVGEQCELMKGLIKSIENLTLDRNEEFPCPAHLFNDGKPMNLKDYFMALNQFLPMSMIQAEIPSPNTLKHMIKRWKDVIEKQKELNDVFAKAKETF